MSGISWYGVAAMKIYLVGGAVRDRLLDLPVAERDWVVVGATPEQMLALGFRRADAEFPVFLHPQTGEEYALARTEVKTGPGYKGFAVEAGPQVTLEQDLMRRDLTINALALDEADNLVDPCGGREDLENGLLRHITPAFSEDPVRLLRVARFAAKLGRWGFRVAHGTHALMKKMAASPDLASLKPERVWRELARAMGEAQPWRFFEVLHRCGALARLMPPLDRVMGDPAVHRNTSRSAPGLAGLERAAAMTDEGVVRTLAALYEPAASQPDPAGWLRSLRAGRNELRLLDDLIALRHGIERTADATALLRLASHFKPQQQEARFSRLLLAAEALWPDLMQRHETELRLAAQVLGERPPETVGRDLQGAALGRALTDWRTTRLQMRMATGHDRESAEEGAS
jgi:tRNA nucleotidyltransferase (CCA-adding enzyme)